jgi:hypothetical protein
MRQQMTPYETQTIAERQRHDLAMEKGREAGGRGGAYVDPQNNNTPFRLDPTSETGARDLQGNEYTPKSMARPGTAGGAGGRQAETQFVRITQASNEVSAAVANLVDLPIGATTGWFMGVQTDRPGELANAVRRSLASTMTSDESKSVITSFQGVARSLAILESAGSAQGLVGLTTAAQTLAPQQGDSGFTVIRKYAEIRQIVERAIETLKAAPSLQQQPQMQTLLDKVRSEIKQTVPWSVKDVNALQRDPSDERVTDFAQRMKAAGAATGGTAPPTINTQKEYDALPAGAPFIWGPDGQKGTKP